LLVRSSERFLEIPHSPFISTMNNKVANKKKKIGGGKLKRAALKEEKARTIAKKLLVEAAQAIPNPLEKFASLKKYNRNDLNVTLEYSKADNLDEDTKVWAFELCKSNMQPAYEESNQGWQAREKRNEMEEEEACYLIAKDASTNKPVAFSHFRFDMDYGDEVLYCYELQLESQYRGKGLGRFMMQVLELMAFSNQMLKVVLTVFKHNKDGMAFFKSCKYEIDETTPEDNDEEEFDYEILSKYNKIKLAEEENEDKKTSL